MILLVTLSTLIMAILVSFAEKKIESMSSCYAEILTQLAAIVSLFLLLFLFVMLCGVSNYINEENDIYVFLVFVFMLELRMLQCIYLRETVVTWVWCFEILTFSTTVVCLMQCYCVQNSREEHAKGFSRQLLQCVGCSSEFMTLTGHHIDNLKKRKKKSSFQISLPQRV